MVAVNLISSPSILRDSRPAAPHFCENFTSSSPLNFVKDFTSSSPQFSEGDSIPPQFETSDHSSPLFEGKIHIPCNGPDAPAWQEKMKRRDECRGCREDEEMNRIQTMRRNEEMRRMQPMRRGAECRR
jgi:hypothetical protein